MARITYGIYLNGKDHCYVISNAETKYAEDIVDETFTNLPIKMTVEALSHSWEDTFDASDNPFNTEQIFAKYFLLCFAYVTFQFSP